MAGSHHPTASPFKDEAPASPASQSTKGLWVLRWVLGDGAKGPPSPASWRRGQNSRQVPAGGMDVVLHLTPKSSPLLSCGNITPRMTRGLLHSPRETINLHQPPRPEPQNTPAPAAAGLGLLEGADGERTCVIYRANNNQSATPASLQMLRADLSRRPPVTANVNDHQPPRHKPLKQLSGIKSACCTVPAPFIPRCSSALQTIL